MVDVKISGLPNAAALTGNEAIPAVQGGSSVKVLVSAIRAGLASDSSVVHVAGDESIGGAKTFTGRPVFSGGAMFPADQTAQWATGARVHATFRGALISSVDHAIFGAGSTSAPGRIAFRPKGNSDNADQITIEPDGSMLFGGSAASKRATCASLNALNLNSTQTVSGLTTFTSEVRIQSVAPGFWLDESDGSNGFFSVVDSGVWQLQVRGPNFGSYVRQMLQVSASGGTFAMGGELVRPLADNAQALGASNYRFTSLWSVNGAVQTSDARLKTPLEHMTDVEEAAFLEIGGLPAKWKWKARVEEEGDAARWHAGPSVQAAIAVMEKHGLSAFAYSAFCYDSWPAEDEVWREWPAQEAEVVEWPAVPETWADIPAEFDEAGEIVVPARRELVHEAMPAGRVVLKEAVEAGRELIQPAVEAGDRYSFRVSELQAWILAATARRDRREREAAELRLANIEQRLAVLESGK